MNAMDGGAPAVLCGICQTPLALGRDAPEPIQACGSCDTPYHAECWDEVGGCARYGCASMHAVGIMEEKLSNDSLCPSCGQTIKVAAQRCRHCGIVFRKTALVGSRMEYSTRVASPVVRDSATRAVLLLLASVFPLTAPGAIGAALLTLLRRRDKPLAKRFRRMALVALVLSMVVTGTICVAIVHAVTAPPVFEVDDFEADP